MAIVTDVINAFKDLNNPYDKYKQVRQRTGVQPGLKEFGNTPFYYTPDSPASPYDCSRYSSSFYCGGVPLSFRFSGIGFSAVNDQCNIGIQVTPVLGFIKLPSNQIVYRAPGCTSGGTHYEGLPQNSCPVSGQNDGSLLAQPDDEYWITAREYYHYEQTADGVTQLEITPVWEEEIKNYKISSQGYIAGTHYFDDQSTALTIDVTYTHEFNLSGSSINRHGYSNAAEIIAQQNSFNIDENIVLYNGYQNVNVGHQSGSSITTVNTDIKSSETSADSTYTIKTVNHLIIIIYQNYYSRSFYNRYYSSRYLPNFAIGKDQSASSQAVQSTCTNSSIKEEVYSYNGNYFPLKIPGKYPGTVDVAGTFVDPFLGTGYYGFYQAIFIDTAQNVVYPIDYNPIEPPPPPNMSCCCDGNGSNNDDLLKAILALLKKIYVGVGVDEFPATVPSTTIKYGNNSVANIQINSVAKLIEWFYKRFDESVGQFPIDIKLQGDDKKSHDIQLPNISETLAELMSLTYQSSLNSDLLINITNRTLIEGGQIKQQDYKTHLAVMAIIDWFGFKTRDVTKKMPLLYTPGKENFKEHLTEGEIDVQVIESEGHANFHSYLHDLLFAAAIIRAVFYRKVDTKDIEKSIVDTIKTTLENIEKAQDINIADLQKMINDLDKDYPQSNANIQ